MTDAEKIAITKYDLLYEQRMSRVETTLENMDKYMRDLKTDIREVSKADFRWIAGIMIGGFGTLFGLMSALFGLMAHGFKWF